MLKLFARTKNITSFNRLYSDTMMKSFLLNNVEFFNSKFDNLRIQNVGRKARGLEDGYNFSKQKISFPVMEQDPNNYYSHDQTGTYSMETNYAKYDPELHQSYRKTFYDVSSSGATVLDYTIYCTFFNKCFLNNSYLNKIIIEDTEFNDSKIYQMIFSGTDFEYTKINRCRISECLFMKHRLFKTKISYSVFSDVKFIDVRFWSPDGDGTIVNTKFSDVTFVDCVFQYIYFKNCEFVNVKFINVDFSRSKFSDCKFKNIKTSGKISTSYELRNNTCEGYYPKWLRNNKGFRLWEEICC